MLKNYSQTLLVNATDEDIEKMVTRLYNILDYINTGEFKEDSETLVTSGSNL